MKKISVIIPVYNGEQFIKTIIKTLKEQTIFKDLEVIFVNDGSTDNSMNIMKEIEKDNDNIIIIDKENGGVSSARNSGIDIASSDYICFLDVDDYIDKDYFETLLRYSNFDMVSSGYIAEYKDKSIINKSKEKKVFDNNFDLMKNFFTGNMDINSVSKLYKRSLVSNIRFNEKLKYSEDKLFVFEYMLNCNSICIIPVAKYHYVIHKNSAIRKNFNEKMFKCIKVAEQITSMIQEKIPDLYKYAKSYEIDSKCRVLSELYNFNVSKKYNEQRKKLARDVRKYSIFEKKKYSSKKHFLAFVLTRINPRVYNFVKIKMKFQYSSL